MLDHYMNNLQLNTPEQIEKTIKDYAILSVYCIRNSKMERPLELQEKLDKLKQLCITACINHNMDFLKLYDSYKSEVINNNEIKEPYADIKDKAKVSTQ